MTSLRAGELAQRAGLSVRTLHHYEDKGLLKPLRRTPSGHRLYGDESLAQLHKVLALKQLGMSLEEIRDWLSNGRFSVLDAVRMQKKRVAGQMQMLKTVERRLNTIEKRMADADQISVDDVLEALEAMQMFEKYYSEEQLKQLEERRVQLGDDKIKEVENEWPQLIAKVRDAQARGVDPQSEEARALAKRWKELIEMFTGGDAGIYKSLSNMYQNEPSVSQRNGLDAGLMDYVGKMMS